VQLRLRSPSSIPLIELVLPALDRTFRERTTPLPHWSIAGGQALALWIDHRSTQDLEIAVAGIPPNEFSPSRNPAVGLIGNSHRWLRNMLIVESAAGQVAFRSMSAFTNPALAWVAYDGRKIAVETPEEIIVHTIRFRAAYFSEVDAFDLSATGRAVPGLANTMARQLEDRLEDLRDALCHLSRKGTVPAAVKPTRAFADLPDMVLDECLALVDRAIELAERWRSYRQAIASSALAGHTVSIRASALMERYASGEIDAEEYACLVQQFAQAARSRDDGP